MTSLRNLVGVMSGVLVDVSYVIKCLLVHVEKVTEPCEAKLFQHK